MAGSLREEDYDQNKYIALDTDRFFAESDEFTMRRTLQEMYVSAHKLDLEMKEAVTNELDSVLRCVDTILQMCALIKGSKRDLDAIANGLDEFRFDEAFEAACRSAASNARVTREELKRELLAWFRAYHEAAILGHLYRNRGAPLDAKRLGLWPDLGGMREAAALSPAFVAQAVEELLNSLPIANYRLLRSNSLLRSYELLFVKPPLLFELVESLDAPGLNPLRPETETLCTFFGKKLKRQALANLSSSSAAVLLESVAVVLLLEGPDVGRTARFVLDKLVERFNAAHAAHGPESNFAETVSRFFGMEVVALALRHFEPELKLSLDRTYQLKLAEHFGSVPLTQLPGVKRALVDHVDTLSAEFPHLNVADDVLSLKSRLRELVETTYTRCATDQALSTMLSVSSAVNSFLKIKQEATNDFMEYFGGQDLEDNTPRDLGPKVAELAAFLRTEPSLTALVAEKTNAIAERANEHLAAKPFAHEMPHTLSATAVHRHNAAFRRWLRDTGALDTVLLLDALSRTPSVATLYKTIATKHLEPLIQAATANIAVDNAPTEGHEGGMNMLRVAHAAAALRSFVEEENGYAPCGFTEILGETALAMCMGGYLAAMRARKLPKILEVGGKIRKNAQPDAGALGLLLRDKFGGADATHRAAYEEYTSLLPAEARGPELYESLKRLVL